MVKRLNSNLPKFQYNRSDNQYQKFFVLSTSLIAPLMVFIELT